MASARSEATFLLLLCCMFAVCSAHRGWQFGSSHDHHAAQPSPSPSTALDGRSKTIVVGGSEHWRFGFDYSDWALKNGPFFINDTLVFKYDAPNSTTFPHSVYLLPDRASFSSCDLSAAKRVANWTQGTGDGFKFVLKQWKPHYFACGERNGLHCKNGTMKFIVTPKIYRGWF